MLLESRFLLFDNANTALDAFFLIVLLLVFFVNTKIAVFKFKQL